MLEIGSDFGMLLSKPKSFLVGRVQGHVQHGVFWIRFSLFDMLVAVLDLVSFVVFSFIIFCSGFKSADPSLR